MVTVGLEEFLPEIYLFSGLIFIIIGVTIFLYIRLFRLRQSKMMASNLRFLSVFAIFRGIAEWGFIYFPYRIPRVSLNWQYILKLIENNLVGLSFIFFLFFGINILEICLSRKITIFLKLTASLVITVWLFFYVFSPLILQNDISTYLFSSEVFSRLFICLPGGLLAVCGLHHHMRQSKYSGRLSTRYSYTLLIISLISYTGLSGFLAPLFQIGVLQSGQFNSASLVPLYRMSVFLIISVTTLLMIKEYRVEEARFISRSSAETAIFRERERIRKDLHDGVIQSIYGIGLHLKYIDHLIINSELREAREKIALIMDNLNSINQDIRKYVMDLKRDELAGLTLQQLVLKLNLNFSSSLHPALQTEIGVRSEPNLTAEEKFQLYHILFELISNAIKHGGAGKISVTVLEKDNCLVIKIEDDGKGIDKELIRDYQALSEKNGFRNVQERVSLINGKIQWYNVNGKGAGAVVVIPVN